MPTQNWTFRSDDETQNNAEPTQLLEQLAVTRESPVPLEVLLAAAREAAAIHAAAAIPTPAPTSAPVAATAKRVATGAAAQPAAFAAAASTTPAISQPPTAPASTTMHAYVPSAVQLGPLPVAARAALQGAQSQLKGSVPMLLANHTAAPSVASPPAATKPAEGARAQPILLAGVAALVLAAAVWNFYPGSPRAGHDANGLRATPASDQSSATPLLREEAAVPCLAESTQYRSSADRDELLRNAIGEFAQGRLERAHALLKEYQQVGCDRATLEALSILERQLTQKTRDH